ncbi:cellulose binding domain-containing protein [Streptomyces sp. YIM 98790]|uniref:cellulose binding domain-containing protein n=1 Tax=Streptomyces sp. YIM 98790 TaxID=2689077 RepID=UPI0028BD71F6|nr:cellulose binding domain-containing protein [Streptomyces sp. YIM 98790]
MTEGTGSTSGGSTSGGSTSGGSTSGGSTTGGSTTGGSTGGTGGCSAAYRTTNDWGSGFTGEVAISCSGASLNGWTASWTWPSGQQLSQSWGADCSQSGTRVTCRNVDWNAGVPDGGSVSFGFIAHHNGTNTAPSDITVS